MRAETMKAVDEWQAEIERIKVSQVDDQTAKTVAELQRECGRSANWVTGYLRKQLAAGLIVETTKTVTASNGAEIRGVKAWRRVKK